MVIELNLNNKKTVIQDTIELHFFFFVCFIYLLCYTYLNKYLRYIWKLEDIVNVYIDMDRYRHEEYVKPQISKADLIVNDNYNLQELLEKIISQ